MEKRIYLAPHVHLAPAFSEEFNKEYMAGLEKIGYNAYVRKIAEAIRRVDPQHVYFEGLMVNEMVTVGSLDNLDFQEYQLVSQLSDFALEGMEQHETRGGRIAALALDCKIEFKMMNSISDMQWAKYVELNTGKKPSVMAYGDCHHPQQYFSAEVDVGLVYDGLIDDNKSMGDLMQEVLFPIFLRHSILP